MLEIFFVVVRYDMKIRFDEKMYFVVVVCGERLEEIVIMLKLVLIFSIKLLYVYIFVED